MDTVRVRGRFITENHEPIEGEISFVPQKVWVEEDGYTYPTFAPHVRLVDGRFDVVLTRPNGWWYQVLSPIGCWHIRIHSDKPEQLLRDLLPKHAAGS